LLPRALLIYLFVAVFSYVCAYNSLLWCGNAPECCSYSGVLQFHTINYDFVDDLLSTKSVLSIP
jgi:hypothetical protein